MKARALLLAGAGMLASQTAAQTVITPDAPGSGFETGTTAIRNGQVTTIDGGRVAGSNLFHSFSQFDLGAGDTARWTSSQADSILNVINRVTGGDPSHIDGTIDSTALPRAGFWFINPAGVVFGDGARVNVPAAAHFSTAHELVLQDGARFSTVTPDGSMLSVAPPQAFGFLGGQADIEASGKLDAGTSAVSLSAANLNLVGASTTSGSITLASVGDGETSFSPDAPFDLAASAGRVTVADSLVDTSSFGDADAGAISILGGEVDLTDSTLDAGTFAAGNAGAISISGDAVNIAGSNLFSDSFGDDATGNANVIDIAGGALTIQNTLLSSRSSGAGEPGVISLFAGSIAVDHSTISSDAGAFASGLPGLIQLSADAIALTNGTAIESKTAGALDGGEIDISATVSLQIDGSSINSNAEETASGFGGTTSLTADTIEITGGSRLESSTEGSGDAGAIDISGRVVSLDNSTVTSNAGPLSTGSGGFITLNATEELVLFQSRVETLTSSIGSSGLISIDQSGRVILTDSEISSSTTEGSSGDALGTLIDADVLVLDGGKVTSGTAGSGAGGLVSITANTLGMTGLDSEISSDTAADGIAGDVLIEVAGELGMESNAVISSRSLSGASGNSGFVGITADSVALFDAALIQTNTQGSGSAGQVLVNAGSVSLSGGGITSNGRAGSSGDAGDVFVTAGTIDLVDQAQIATDMFGSGNAGNVTITTDTLGLGGQSFVSSDALADGNAGNVSIKASEIALDGGAYISSDAVGTGNSGSVTLDTGTLFVAGEAYVSSDALGDGDAGGVTITADSIELVDSFIRTNTSGIGNAGAVSIDTGSLSADGGGVTSNAKPGSSGDAGGVSLTAGTIELSNGAQIASDTFGSGNAGGSLVSASSLSLDQGSFISSDALDTGNAGNVSVQADSILLDRESYISSDTEGPGNAGNVDITGGSIVINRDAYISSDSLGCTLGECAGTAGFVTVSSQSLDMDSGGSISSDTYGDGNAGDVLVQASAIRISHGAFVSSDSLGCSSGECAGEAGFVTVIADRLDITDQGFVSSDTNGPGRGGDVFVSATDLLRIDNGSITADTLGCVVLCQGGFGGSVTVQGGNLSLTGSDAEISSDTSGSGFAGNIVVDAMDVSIGAGARLSSVSFPVATGDSGAIQLTSKSLALDGGRITTTTRGSGNAGFIDIATGEFKSAGGTISSDTTGCLDSCFGGDAGFISIKADRFTASGGQISSDTFNDGDAQFVSIESGSVAMQDGARLSSSTRAGSAGDSGLLSIDTGALTLGTGSVITTSTAGSGDAGGILITASAVTLDGAAISSSGETADAGGAGAIILSSKSLDLRNGARISTVAVNVTEDSLGFIQITAPDSITLNTGSTISTDNIRITTDAGATEAQAGQISLESSLIEIRDGSQVTSSSSSGAAGGVTMTLPLTGIVRLEGTSAQGVIRTSSTPGTGGQISIAKPLAIISNGGRILAQGQQRGALVVLDTDFFINSFDRRNEVSVDGAFAVTADIYDVSAGTTTPVVNFLDASRVLSGQCAATRASGETSQLSARPLGPYLRQGTGSAGGALVPGGCL